MSTRDHPADPVNRTQSAAQEVQSGAVAAPAPEPAPGEASLGELVGRLGQDLSRLMRAEIALAKAEAKEEVVQAARGAGMFAGAGVAGHLLLIFASLALMFGLGAWMRLGWAALIVAVLWAVVAAVLAASGRSNLRRIPPPMEQTVETVKEDARWARKPRG